MTKLDYTFERQLTLERISAREEGQIENSISSIQDFLSDYGTIPKSINKQLDTIKDLEILRKLVKKAGHVNSIEEFEQSLNELSK